MAAQDPPDYAELHALSNFTFLRGASHPEEMATAAAALGLTAIGIADRNSLAGVVRAHVAARVLLDMAADHLVAVHPTVHIRYADLQSLSLLMSAGIP